MSNSKIFLNVPFAQKDEAKALGAKWDPSKKKWYISSNLDILLFSQWNTNAVSSVSTSKASKASSTLGTMTHAKDKNFIAYSGDQPPWN